MELFDIDFEDALQYPLFLRRLLQMHIMPMPIAKNQLETDDLTLPTLDFGSRLTVTKSDDGRTIISSSVSSARVIDGVDFFGNLCPVRLPIIRCPIASSHPFRPSYIQRRVKMMIPGGDTCLIGSNIDKILMAMVLFLR